MQEQSRQIILPGLKLFYGPSPLGGVFVCFPHNGFVHPQHHQPQEALEQRQKGNGNMLRDHAEQRRHYQKAGIGEGHLDTDHRLGFVFS